MRKTAGEMFRQFAAYVSSKVAASPLVLLVVVGVLTLSGWYYGFSEKWEHTTTFIVAIATFLMIFFLQNSQNFGEKVTHLKLDELIRAVEGTRIEIVSAEEKEEHEIDALRQTTIEEHKDAQIIQKQG
ncbi:MAG TPA: low affinity iron permease family protein [Blastocatellia bacterium]|nr:low affinity iron permease family protein [Blastocatellia bacterium]